MIDVSGRWKSDRNTRTRHRLVRSRVLIAVRVISPEDIGESSVAVVIAESSGRLSTHGEIVGRQSTSGGRIEKASGQAR